MCLRKIELKRRFIQLKLKSIFAHGIHGYLKFFVKESRVAVNLYALFVGVLAMSSISFSGLASGIDSDSLIKSMMESRRIAELPLKNKISDNERETSALEEFNSKLLSLRSQLDPFLTLRGGGLEKTGKSSNSDALTITASSGSPTSTSDIEVQQLARAGSFSFRDRFTSYDQSIAPQLTGQGKIAIAVGQGENTKTFNVDIDSGTKLTDLVNQINAKAEGYLHASIVNAGSSTNPQYLLYVSGIKTGEEEGSLNVTVDDVLTNQGILTETNLEQARDAIINVQGVGDIRRSSNQISDVVPGATLNLKQVFNGNISLAVGTDPEKTADKVAAFVDTINEIVSFSKSNSTIERVEKDGKVDNIYGDLGHTRVDENFVQQLRSVISSMRSDESGTTVHSFAELGISTQKDGTFSLDRTKLVAAINKDPTSCDNLLSKFADRLGSVNGVINKFTQYQGVIQSTQDSNASSSTSLQSKIDRMERSIEAQAASMRMTYANMEATFSRLQSSGNALNSMMTSFNSNS